jgi:imidazolonepropionase-like amidohydrolase
MKTLAFLLAFSLFINCCIISSFSQSVKIIKGVTLIDGTGAGPKQNVNVVIKGDVIDAVLSSNTSLPKDATVTDYSGKFVMPALINGHAHLGLLTGDNSSPNNYTRENILRHLQKYQQYGISTVLSLGTDREIIFPLRDSSRKGLLPGATIYTAGYGITAKGKSPPANLAPDLMQPQTIEDAVKDVDELALLKPDFVKIWVDDFYGTAAKMQPEIYEAVIKESHKKGLRVAAHVYYLEDAKRLVNAGVDALAHSIRDKDVDDELINAMKQNGVYYIPTLTLDEYNIIYADDAPWINDPFFKASLEPGVLERLTSAAFRQQLQNDTTLSKKKAALETAMRNLKKLADADVVIVLGSDSGAQPVRAQGFSEHLELQLMVEAGLTPMQAIVAATNNGAKLLQVNKQCGALKTNMKADFIVLDGDPLSDIKQTRNIVAVWKNGVQVGNGIWN